jgi:AraC family transcriptional regulator
MKNINTYELLQTVLLEIERDIKGKMDAKSLAKVVHLSASHLQRLFRLAFERPLANYVRSRKLAASVEALLKTGHRVIDIAEEYGFDYEQSYIRAFKREYGITPGEVRSGLHIIKVTPPLSLDAKSNIGGHLLFGPEIVMVPQFSLVGREHHFSEDC